VRPDLFIRDATGAFLILVPAVIGWQILTGRIEMGGMLYERDPAGRLVYSPARLQLLLVSLAGAAQLLWRFTGNPDHLASANPLVLAGMGASQLSYLASKAWAAYQAKK